MNSTAVVIALKSPLKRLCSYNWAYTFFFYKIDVCQQGNDGSIDLFSFIYSLKIQWQQVDGEIYKSKTHCKRHG